MELIEVRKQLPKSDTYVLAILHGRFVTVSYYFEDSFGSWWSSQWSIYDQKYTHVVTHWMPLKEIQEKIKDLV